MVILVYGPVANECLMVQMHVSHESDVLYICVSDSCCGFWCSDNIRCVVLMCFFICSSWLKPGSYIKSQHSPKNCHPCFFGSSSSCTTCACRMGSNCSKEVKPAMKFGWLVTKSEWDKVLQTQLHQRETLLRIPTIGFTALTFSGSEPAASYVLQHVIFDSSRAETWLKNNATGWSMQ